MSSPVNSAEDLAKQTKIKYGTFCCGSTNAFFGVSITIIIKRPITRHFVSSLLFFVGRFIFCLIAELNNPNVCQVECFHGVDKAECDDKKQQRGLGQGRCHVWLHCMGIYALLAIITFVSQGAEGGRTLRILHGGSCNRVS